MATDRRSLLWNVCASWVSHGVSLTIGFFLMPFVLRTLGDSAYGSWVFINSIAGYAALMYLGFGDTIAKYVAQYHARREWDRLNGIVSFIVSVYLCMGGVALAIAGVLAIFASHLHDWLPNELHEIRLVIVILGLNVATGLAGSAFGGVLAGLRRFDLDRCVGFCGDMVRLSLLILFLHRERGLVTIASVYFVVTLVESTAYVVLAYRMVPQLSIRLRHQNLSALRDCAAFSGFAFLSAIASQLIYATDTVVIGFLLGTEAIVPYHIALRLCQFLRLPIQKIADICMPTAGALHAQSEDKHLQRLVVKVMGISFLLAAGLFTGAMFFGDRLIVSWVGSQYAESHRLLLVLFGVQVIALPAGVLRAVLFGIGYVRVPSLVYLAEALVNLGLSLALCGPFGLMGVALGTAIPVVVFELGILLPYGMRRLDIRPWELVRDTVGAQLLPLTALLAYAVYVDSITLARRDWLSLVVITTGGGVVLAAGWATHAVLHRRHLRRAV